MIFGISEETITNIIRDMETSIKKPVITIVAEINAPVIKVWTHWTDPKHIIHWNNASDDWHTPRAENDLRVGGKFLSRMEAKDGSTGFDFSGKYIKVELYKQIEYTLDDKRKVKVSFVSDGNKTTVTESFEAEQENSIELQQSGWQAILDNFRKYVENSGKTETLHFKISINASVEKVYQTMLDEKKYIEWASEFNPTSCFKGSWEKGSKILFLGTDKDGNVGGMVSEIRENIPCKYVSIKHLGIYQDGKEIFTGSEVEQWPGALENYSFTDVNGKTMLSVEQDSTQEFASYFTNTWPKALKKLKTICEE
jgi:uncharacterized protein YndB with AHSA1/START domain